jgi:hypothetical protein
LSRRQFGNSVGRGFPPREQLARIPRQRQSTFDDGEQFIAADRLLDEVQSARLHGLNRDCR